MHILQRFLVSLGVLIALSQVTSVWAAWGDPTDPKHPSVDPMHLQAFTEQREAFANAYRKTKNIDDAADSATDLFDCITLSGKKFSHLDTGKYRNPTEAEYAAMAASIAQLAGQFKTAQMVGGDAIAFPFISYQYQEENRLDDNRIVAALSLYDTLGRLNGLIPEDRLAFAKQEILKDFANFRNPEHSSNSDLHSYTEEGDFDRFDAYVNRFLPYIDAYFEGLQKNEEGEEQFNDEAFSTFSMNGLTALSLSQPAWASETLKWIGFIRKDGGFDVIKQTLRETASEFVFTLLGADSPERVYYLNSSSQGLNRPGLEQETYAGHWIDGGQLRWWTHRQVEEEDAKGLIDLTFYDLASEGNIQHGAPVRLLTHPDNMYQTFKDAGYLLLETAPNTLEIYDIRTGSATRTLETLRVNPPVTEDHDEQDEFGEGDEEETGGDENERDAEFDAAAPHHVASNYATDAEER